MIDVLKELKARKPVIGETGYWIDTDTMGALIAEMEANRAANVVENVGGEAASLARKYDWISRQGDGLISAADVARDIRETFGVGDQHAGRADPVFDPAITSCDPYDERPGPYYDMKKVREIEAETGIAFGAASR